MEKHTAIIYGVDVEKTWKYEEEIYYWNYPRRRNDVRYSSKEVDTEIWSGELDFPPVNVGDKIYISEDDIYVTVSEVIRTTYNEYIYKTIHVVDEYVLDSLEEDRLKAIEEWFTEQYLGLEKFEELKRFKPEEEVDELSEKEVEFYKKAWYRWFKFFK